MVSLLATGLSHHSYTLLPPISTLQETAIAPHSLVLEIIESTVIEDAESDKSMLKRLTDLGIPLAPDDFGTDYSSLAYLSLLPVDLLKIDKCFVDRLGEDPEGKAIVEAMISLAHALYLQVVAEGIETIEQLIELQTLGCEMGARGSFQETCRAPHPARGGAVGVAAQLKGD